MAFDLGHVHPLEFEISVVNHLVSGDGWSDLDDVGTVFADYSWSGPPPAEINWRTDEARELFENMLSCRTSLGLLSEDLNPETQEPWGNFPQTYSMAGIINGAMRLSRTWEDVL